MVLLYTTFVGFQCHKGYWHLHNKRKGLVATAVEKSYLQKSFCFDHDLLFNNINIFVVGHLCSRGTVSSTFSSASPYCDFFISQRGRQQLELLCYWFSATNAKLECIIFIHQLELRWDKSEFELSINAGGTFVFILFLIIIKKLSFEWNLLISFDNERQVGANKELKEKLNLKDTLKFVSNRWGLPWQN